MGELDYIRQQKILSILQIKDDINFCKQKSQDIKIVFTNGCFDILHIGHIEYLAKAKEMGDRLIIGLNSDNSVRKLKGEDRPINNELSRATILASLSFVDIVVIFDDETPENIIEMIKPDVLVKGGDYTEENIVGSEFVRSYGGIVNIVDLVDGYSSTKIIYKLKR
jgi:rfaE bifunctional protein nucleotidyltransferase chain/domain